jgi:hypothetical protein
VKLLLFLKFPELIDLLDRKGKVRGHVCGLDLEQGAIDLKAGPIMEFLPMILSPVKFHSSGPIVLTWAARVGCFF